MGCSQSKPSPTGPPLNEIVPDSNAVSKAIAAHESRLIEAHLAAAQREDESKIKMLLLGAGESGKSTIFKQIRILYGTARSEEDLRMYGVVARSNIVVAARKLCSHLRNLGLE
mmetsp:Transcript_28789/g.62018  ORF Transcript_28789/g.62018 Transcript_28789/m.62018 type:complete len:113 (+) Transcript_28789:113-451(+)